MLVSGILLYTAKVSIVRIRPGELDEKKDDDSKDASKESDDSSLNTITENPLTDSSIEIEMQDVYH